MTMITLPIELLQAFAEIQQPRSRFALERFVVGQKFTTPAQYSQCVLEAQIKWDNIRTARLELEKKDLEIAAISTPGRLGEIEKELKLIEREQTERAMLGAERELACLIDIFNSFPRQYTYEELQLASEEEYKQKLITQSIQDYTAFGHVTPGNQDALRMIKATLNVESADDGRTRLVVETEDTRKKLKGE